MGKPRGVRMVDYDMDLLWYVKDLYGVFVLVPELPRPKMAALSFTDDSRFNFFFGCLVRNLLWSADSLLLPFGR